jgi:hypothetical protein
MAMLIPSVVSAQVVTDAQSLRQRCATVQWTNPSAGLACRGYIGAVADILADGHEVYGRRACPPPGTSREAVVKTVRDWLGRHPEQLQQRAARVIVQALAEAYPCAN